MFGFTAESRSPSTGFPKPALPTYEVTLPSLLRGILSLRKQYLFVRPLNAPSILIRICVGGSDGKGFRRLLHPNGVCLGGLWEIREETKYSIPRRTRGRRRK